MRDLGYNLMAMPKYLFPLFLAVFLCFFNSLRVIFFADLSFQANAIYHWKRFRDSNLKDSLDFLLRVPEYVRYKVEAVHVPVIDRYGDQYFADGSDKKWDYRWLPDLLLKILGKKNLHSAVSEWINKSFRKKNI